MTTKVILESNVCAFNPQNYTEATDQKTSVKVSAVASKIIPHSTIQPTSADLTKTVEKPKSLLLVEQLIKELAIPSLYPTTYCIRPALGCSGFTFLCQVSNIYPDFKPSDVKFVLKWIKKDQAEIEKFCSDVLKNYGLITPDITFIDFETGKKFIPFIKKIAPCIENIDNSYQLIFMQEFQAETLSSMIKNRQI